MDLFGGSFGRGAQNPYWWNQLSGGNSGFPQFTAPNPVRQTVDFNGNGGAGGPMDSGQSQTATLQNLLGNLPTYSGHPITQPLPVSGPRPNVNPFSIGGTGGWSGNATGTVLGQGSVNSAPQSHPYVGSYKRGGFIKKTGMALVHKGEYVIPAPMKTLRATLSKRRGK